MTQTANAYYSYARCGFDTLHVDGTKYGDSSAQKRARFGRIKLGGDLDGPGPVATYIVGETAMSADDVDRLVQAVRAAT